MVKGSGKGEQLFMWTTVLAAQCSCFSEPLVTVDTFEKQCVPFKARGTVCEILGMNSAVCLKLVKKVANKKRLLISV